MGVVWRAHDERLDRVVAVKQVLGDDAERASTLGIREGRVAARIRHPHAIMVHDVVDHDGKPCLIMEYFPAQTLAQRGVLPPDEVARMGSQLAAALAAAHADGIVHRDVKPGNVLISSAGTAKIADFGISRALGDGTLTGEEIMVGTPAYLAPEVAAGEQTGFSSDVFSLGATLYAALEGRPPFGDDDNPIALLRRVAGGEIIPPRQAGPVVDVMLWMLRHNSGERPTMHEAHEALAAVADGSPVWTPRPEPRVLNPTLELPARKPSRRAIGVGIVALLLVTAGIVIGTLIGDRPATVVAANTQSAQPTPTTTTADNPGCAARYEVTNSWPGGYQATVTVLNNDRPALTGWEVRWALPAGHSINNLWNGTLAQDGSSVTVTNANWNAVVAAQDSTTFGLTANEPNGDGPARPALTCWSR